MLCLTAQHGKYTKNNARLQMGRALSFIYF